MGPYQAMIWSWGFAPPPPITRGPMASRYRSSTRVTDYLYPFIIVIGILLWQH